MSECAASEIRQKMHEQSMGSTAMLRQLSFSTQCNAPDALEIGIGIKFASRALCIPDCFAEAFEKGVFGFMDIEACTQGFVGGADACWLVDADLVGDGQMQRKVEKGIHPAALRGELLRQCIVRVFKQGVVFGMLFDQIRSGCLGTFKDQMLAMFTP